jgi:hypothetical protein
MTDVMVTSVSLDCLRDVLQQAGYRVEFFADPAGTSRLRSATAGLPFELCLGPRLNDDGGHVHGLLIAALQLEGELPFDLVNHWNSLRRFGRLHRDRSLLVLTMDVLVAGGVTLAHVRAQFEIWDRLVQELVPFLRAELGQLATNGSAHGAAIGGAPTAQLPAGVA